MVGVLEGMPMVTVAEGDIVCVMTTGAYTLQDAGIKVSIINKKKIVFFIKILPQEQDYTLPFIYADVNQ